MSSAWRRLQAILTGCLVSAFSAVVLAGMLSMLRLELVFAGFIMGGALGGAVTGYRARVFPMAQGVAAGLVAGLVELGFLVINGVELLPLWIVATLVALCGVAGMLGARMGFALHQRPLAEPGLPVSLVDLATPDGEQADARV